MMKAVNYVMVVCACALTGSLANGAVLVSSLSAVRSNANDGSGFPPTVQSLLTLPSSGSNSVTDGLAAAASGWNLSSVGGVTQFNLTSDLDSGGLGSSANSVGSIFFTLTEQADFEVMGLFNLTPLGVGSVDGQSTVTLKQGFTNIYFGGQSFSGGNQTTALNNITPSTGTLAPGQYEFAWNISASHGFGLARTTLTSDLGLVLTSAVPTPGSVALFGLAGGAITRRRRRGPSC